MPALAAHEGVQPRRESRRSTEGCGDGLPERAVSRGGSDPQVGVRLVGFDASLELLPRVPLAVAAGEELLVEAGFGVERDDDAAAFVDGLELVQLVERREAADAVQLFEELRFDPSRLSTEEQDRLRTLLKKGQPSAGPAHAQRPGQPAAAR